MSPEPQTAERGDASVGLLHDLMATALEPDYRRASDRTPPKGEGDGHRRRGAARWATVAALLVLGIMVGASIADVRSSALPQARLEQDALAARVAERVAITDAAAAEVDRLEAQVAELAERGDRDDDLLVALETAAAARPARGEGVVVTLEDAEASTDDTEGLGRVLDRDLQLVANGLWAAGAEAVAINDRRLTSTSAIRGAGDAILVDYRPLEPPYRVVALGPADALRAGFENGASGLALRTLADAYGLRFTIERSDALEVPAGSLPALRYAAPLSSKEQETPS
jgi:uncharacterized protein YlxW (UPF0749 family)